MVSLTVQFLLAGAGRDGGAMLSNSLSMHSSRSARSSEEQARNFANGSLASCARAIPLATATDSRTAAVLTAMPALRAPVDPAMPAPPGSGLIQGLSQQD